MCLRELGPRIKLDGPIVVRPCGEVKHNYGLCAVQSDSLSEFRFNWISAKQGCVFLFKRVGLLSVMGLLGIMRVL